MPQIRTALDVQRMLQTKDHYPEGWRQHWKGKTGLQAALPPDSPQL
jgi:hypothetical protein